MEDHLIGEVAPALDLTPEPLLRTMLLWLQLVHPAERRLPPLRTLLPRRLLLRTVLLWLQLVRPAGRRLPPPCAWGLCGLHFVVKPVSKHLSTCKFMCIH